MKKPGKKKEAVSYLQKMLMMKKAGIGMSPVSSLSPAADDKMEPLSERIPKILGLTEKKPKATEMIYIIMYDIEDNKVRGQVSKYLDKMGCIRIQKSIFMAKTERSVFDRIHKDLTEVNELYDNTDSIIMVPVTTDEVRSMKLLGNNVDMSFFVNKPNTMIF